MKLLGSYLMRQYKLILLLLSFAAIFACVFFLYNLPVEAVGYASVLCMVVGSLFFCVGFLRYRRHHHELQMLLKNQHEAWFRMPPPSGALENDYQQLVKAVAADRNRIDAENENSRREMMEYYTRWVHQIKTPIAAMHLLLQQGAPVDEEALGGELFKIEEYVGMVLSYLRLDSDTTDYVLGSCGLDELVKSCVRKYARLIILKKIELEFVPTHLTVVTDRKWMEFMLGQILSNAVKYTPTGGKIKIYAQQGELNISDSGIGIRPEDLPRVFEKGFTGYNGRREQKSSGLGLSLCRQVSDRLGVRLAVASLPGKGTTVSLKFPQKGQMVE